MTRKQRRQDIEAQTNNPRTEIWNIAGNYVGSQIDGKQKHPESQTAGSRGKTYGSR